MADPRTIAATLTAQFRSAFADELRSVVVFGSQPRGEAIPGVSDLNILVLVESMTNSTLVRAAPVLRQWIQSGHTPPYLYSWEEWNGMQDALAIEITDMFDAREVLWGPDPLVTQSVSYADLRAHAEQEIRQMQLQLRLRLMVSATDPAAVGVLLLNGLPSFTAYMRAALRLSDQSPELKTRAVVEHAAALIGADTTEMLACLTARQSAHHFEVPLNSPMVDRYTQFVNTLAGYINALPKDKPGAADRTSGGVGAPALSMSSDSAARASR